MGGIFDFHSRGTAQAPSCVDWELRYDGAMSVAVIDAVPVAGISGPWPDGNYALTWWATRAIDSPPSLEFFNSMATAQRRVEDIAIQMARKM